MRGNAQGAGLDSRAAKTGKAGAGGDSWHGLRPRECAGMRGNARKCAEMRGNAREHGGSSRKGQRSRVQQARRYKVEAGRSDKVWRE